MIFVIIIWIVKWCLYSTLFPFHEIDSIDYHVDFMSVVCMWYVCANVMYTIKSVSVFKARPINAYLISLPTTYLDSIRLISSL